MLRFWLLVSMLAACGRLGFDSVASSGDGAPGDGVEVPLELAMLPCETDHVLGGTLPLSDNVRVVYGDAPYVIDVHHVTNTLHEVHAYRLGARDGVVISTDLGTVYTLADIAGFAIERSGSDYVMILTDATTKVTRVVRVDAAFAKQSDTMIGSLGFGHPPFARSSAGAMVVGETTGGMLQVRSLDASYAPSGGPVTLATGAFSGSIAPAGADFLVAWAAAGVCRFARVDAAGAIVAGPVDVDIGSTCTFPVPAILDSGAIAYLVHSQTTSMSKVFGGTIDENFTGATAPVALGGTASFAQQLVSGAGARIPVVDGGTVRVIDMTAGGVISQAGANIGTVALEDAVWIESVGDASVLFRIEAKRLVVRKLCR